MSLVNLNMGGARMAKKTSLNSPNHRRFLKNSLQKGRLFCLGSNNFIKSSQPEGKQKVSSAKHKFLKKSGMTFKEIFQFKYDPYISTMQRLANFIGKDKFIEMLKKASAEVATQRVKNIIRNLPKNDFDTFIKTLVFTPFFKNTLSMEIIERTDKVLEIKITECLWAKTVLNLKEPDAADIGYALICCPEIATALAFNPKIKTIRTKTLMQGDDCCNPRLVWEG